MRRIVPLAFLLAAFAAAGASAATESTQLIRPSQGIGKVRLGMSDADLRRVLGRPRVAIPRSAGFGRRTVDYEFGYGEYGVRLFGTPGRLRVVRVTTTLRRERTPSGIGPGSSERALLRAYPALRCPRLATLVAHGTVYVTTDERECTLRTPSGRRTVFVSGVGRGALLVRLRDWDRQARVLEVAVAAGG